MIILIIIASWIVCCFISYGMAYPIVEHIFEDEAFELRKKNYIMSIALSIFGPFSLISIIGSSFIEYKTIKFKLHFKKEKVNYELWD